MSSSCSTTIRRPGVVWINSSQFALINNSTSSGDFVRTNLDRAYSKLVAQGQYYNKPTAIPYTTYNCPHAGIVVLLHQKQRQIHIILQVLRHEPGYNSVIYVKYMYVCMYVCIY